MMDLIGEKNVQREELKWILYDGIDQDDGGGGGISSEDFRKDGWEHVSITALECFRSFLGCCMHAFIPLFVNNQESRHFPSHNACTLSVDQLVIHHS
mmetsp:Transcript_3674/g.13981  ORF Transcript_3674/g.13981 Transcript_3674/m.13981 type:complete len:97 (+) Transcript_3674:274-564(+)